MDYLLPPQDGAEGPGCPKQQGIDGPGESTLFYLIFSVFLKLGFLKLVS